MKPSLLRSLFPFFVLIFLLPLPILQADTLYLKDGTVLKGKIQKKRNQWIITLSNGLIAKYSMDQVKKVEKDQGPSGEKMKKTGQKEWQRKYALALKARKAGQLQRYQHLLREVLTLHPNHYPSRIALGYVKYKGKWMKKEDFLKKIGYGKWKGRILPQKKIQKAKEQENLAKQVKKSKLFFEKSFGHMLQEKLSSRMKQKFSPKVLELVYSKIARNSSSPKRLFALGELAKFPPHPRIKTIFTYSMLYDPNRKIREKAYSLLKKAGGPHPKDIPLLLKGLKNPSPITRFSALGAVKAFHIKKALPILYSRIDDLQRAMSMPRQHAFFGTSRSYIKEWKLGSSGTQQQGQEVPDPVVDTFLEGVVIETQIISIEYYLVRKTIQKLRK